GRRPLRLRISPGSDLPGYGRSFAYRDDPGVVLAGQLAEHRLEILGLAEIAIDRGEADIGDVVELAQMLHHDLADRLRRNLGLAATLELAHDGRDDLLDALAVARPLAQRDLHRAHQLVAVKGNAATVALDHRQLTQLHALEGGEAEIAGDADAPPPDHGRILGRTRVLHLRIERVAARTAHPKIPLLIDREAVGQRPHPFLDRGLDQRRLAVGGLRDRVQDLGDHAADLLELGNPEAAGGRGRRAQTKT